ncbi:MAG TPA: hypothetical protein VD908_11430 [Cytophagales bacterium]|nr:hypothetical protein [Cytophagales bacterium]
MKIKSFISQFSRYFLVVICFLAISSNLYSFYFDSQVKEVAEISKTVNEDQGEEESDEPRFCAYEAVVPVVHFNKICHFVLKIIQVEVYEAPVGIIKDSPAFFTRPFYRTLFRMIISPNAP